MAQTVTIKSVQLNQPRVDNFGNPDASHIINYLNSSGKEVAAHIFSNTPLFEVLNKTPLVAGKKYDFSYVKNGKFFNLEKISPAGTVAKSETTYTKKGGWTPPSADRDLSMDLGGLMHDVATLVAAGKRTNVEETLLELYTIKKTLIETLKGGSTPKPVQQNEAALHEERTQAVVSFEADNEDPF